MKVYRYKDYGQYKAVQVKANKAKIKNCWVRPEVVDLIAERLININPSPTFGLCHGTRRGEEQRMFRARLGCPVIGTEISDNATKYPDTIEWDFHNLKDEWRGACDFVYSNSLDHAYNPAGAVRNWIACLKESGVLIIEWVEKMGKGLPKKSTAVDPFEAATEELCLLIHAAGGEVLEVVPVKRPGLSVSLIFAGRLP